jgi:hypothetical protein
MSSNSNLIKNIELNIYIFFKKKKKKKGKERRWPPPSFISICFCFKILRVFYISFDFKLGYSSPFTNLTDGSGVLISK